ncbi:hypothetical protein EVAR_50449_1 [Eumeta japonica]|uniref:Uncharacterized protein n=1 Tax=Eumeta variegata TaxID=151549 RepID=A0A4C1XUA4_EUMVA|nr:hypothetical protein EVAR_50447_1 [Eumeta japonica]GBP66623.1 hypothetical protein EVAR_50448_1 [Eumeta japonica]GBP66624.1 hypothetical protein EVAR_50449_1 [Eumeta japonica]
MMKLVVLTLCLFAAAAYASPAAFEEEAVPENYPLPLSVPVEGASLPMGAARACTNSLCLSLCRALGWPRGVCLDRNTCFCWR